MVNVFPDLFLGLVNFRPQLRYPAFQAFDLGFQLITLLRVACMVFITEVVELLLQRSQVLFLLKPLLSQFAGIGVLEVIQIV